ncbi:MAG: prepilin-type N-terminal cleavage/methylation domain-containing protein [Robiginitomaculum sp.]|nr:prepilin-type N-terminal cleavage/methylation domain-containing protein [Robiginitomaculum sp.]
MNRARHNTGLTLVELLVAMIIGALVLVILVQGLSGLSKWSHHLRVLQENNEKTGSLFRFIQERLIRIEPLQIETKDGLQVLFSGTQNEIKFIVAETVYPASPGLYEQSLQITKASEENWQVIFYRQPLIRLDQFGTEISTQPLVIFNNSTKPEFSFLGDAAWQKQWDLPQTMPRKIAFNIDGWPAIVISVPKVISSPTTQSSDTKPEEEASSDEG